MERVEKVLSVIYLTGGGIERNYAKLVSVRNHRQSQVTCSGKKCIFFKFCNCQTNSWDTKLNLNLRVFNVIFCNSQLYYNFISSRLRLFTMFPLRPDYSLKLQTLFNLESDIYGFKLVSFFASSYKLAGGDG